MTTAGVHLAAHSQDTAVHLTLTDTVITHAWSPACKPEFGSSQGGPEALLWCMVTVVKSDSGSGGERLTIAPVDHFVEFKPKWLKG
jgi:hypothetical protein